MIEGVFKNEMQHLPTREGLKNSLPDAERDKETDLK